jgi:hypothetical protein
MSQYFYLQTAMFEAATAASTQIERQRTANRSKIRRIEEIPSEIGKAERELSDALRMVNRYRSDIRSVSQWASSRRVLDFSWLLPESTRNRLARLWPIFQVVEPRVSRIRDDLRAMKATSTQLVTFLVSPSFLYGGRPVVDSCADYRAFKRNYDAAVIGLDQTLDGLVDMQGRLGFYGTAQGKSLRAQLRDALALFAIDIYAMADSVNGIRGNNALVTACTAFPEKLWDLIFKSVSGRRNKAQFKEYYKGLRLSQKKNLVKNGLANFRDQLREAGRGAEEARSELMSIFQGLGKHIAGQSGPTSPAVEGYKGLTAAISTVQGIQAQLASMPAAPDASVIQCQAGSGYSGIFGGEEGDASSPLMVVGGGLIAGVAIAHFFPNLLR